MSRLKDVFFTAVTPLNYKTSRTTLFRIHEMAVSALWFIIEYNFSQSSGADSEPLLKFFQHLQNVVS